MRIVGGKYRSRRFSPPAQMQARPTTDFARESLFNILENRFDWETVTALDLFSGTGAISFELLSRGCPAVVCVEQHRLQYGFIRKVAQQLRADRLLPIRGDVFKYIESSCQTFDFIFADPPYDLDRLPEIPRLVLDSGLLKPDGLLVVEHSKKNDFSRLPEFEQLRRYGSVHFSFFRPILQQR